MLFVQPALVTLVLVAVAVTFFYAGFQWWIGAAVLAVSAIPILMCSNAPAARAGYGFSPRFIHQMPPQKS